MFCVMDNEPVAKVMFQNARQGFIAKGNELIYREIVKQATGTDIEITDTKNDTGRITGVEFASSQVVTTQGKNLFDKTKVVLNYVIDSLGAIVPFAGEFYQTTFIKVNADTNYILNKNGVSSTSRVPVYDINGVFITRLGSTTNNTNNMPIKIPSNGAYVKLSCTTSALNSLQFELGTATAYTPFIPNSPSPDYPSPIYNTGDGGILNVTSSNGTVTDTYPITLPDGFVGGSLPNGVKDTDTMQYIKKLTGISGTSVTISDMKSNGSFWSTVGGTISDKTITFSASVTNATVEYELDVPVDISASITLPLIDTYDKYTKIECLNAVKPVMTVKYLEK